MIRNLCLITLTFLILLLPGLILNKTKINDLIIQSEDTLPALFLPINIINDKTLYADKYYEMIRARYPHPDDKDQVKNLTPFYFRRIAERFYDYENNKPDIKYHYISAFPLMSGFLALPVYFLPLKLGMPITWENLALLGRITSALTMTISGVFMYLLLKKHFYNSDKQALLLSGIFIFATINLSLVSQSLWQHGPLQLFTILSVFFIFEKKWFLSGVFLSLAILARPTSIIFLPFLLLLILSRLLKIDENSSREEIIKTVKDAPKSVVSFLVGHLPAYGLFFWYTSEFYKGLSNNGYAGQIMRNWLSRFPEGFLGMWLSPSKGILVYSPIFVFGFVSMWLIARKGEWKLRRNFKYVISFCVVILHTFILSRWKHWYGGWSFGYRMASDVLPFLIFMLVPFVQSEFFEKWKKVFFVLLGISVLMQIQGLVFFDGVWHAAFDRGFVDTGWLWSLVNSETVFNIRRLLVKLGVLVSACPKCI